MNEKVIVKEYDFNKPIIQKRASLIVNFLKNCLHKYFHTFDQLCEYDLSFTNIVNNESINFTISDKIMGLYVLNKKLTIAYRNGFIFNQINKLTKKIVQISQI